MEQTEKTKTTKQTYSKSAFLDAAKDSTERLLLNVLLNDQKKYSKDEVEKLVNDWKAKEVKA